MRSHADKPSLVEHKYLVGIYYRADSLRDYEQRRIGSGLTQGFTQNAVCLEVERGERIVENEYFRSKSRLCKP